MKKIKKWGIASLAVCMMLGGAIFSASAEEEGVPYSYPTVENLVGGEIASVSAGLDVIAYENDMAMAGIAGNALYFSADRFACAMNLSEVDHITVTRLPDATCGSLYIGSEGVSVGQKIKASDLSLMTYETAENGAGNNARRNCRDDGEVSVRQSLYDRGRTGRRG